MCARSSPLYPFLTHPPTHLDRQGHPSRLISAQEEEEEEGQQLVHKKEEEEEEEEKEEEGVVEHRTYSLDAFLSLLQGEPEEEEEEEEDKVARAER